MPNPKIDQFEVDSVTYDLQDTETKEDLGTHEANTSNPHSVTKAQVGLGNVDNTSDLNKPVSTAQQTALDGKVPNANIDTTIPETPVDTHVPSTKLVNDKFVKHNTYDGTLSVKKADEADEAKSLATSVGITDQTPFSEQTTGGSSDITTGIQNLNKLVGCKVVKNQLLNMFSYNTTTQNGITATKNNDGTWTISGTATGDVEIQIGAVKKISGHKYLLFGAFGGSASTWYLRDGTAGQNDEGKGTIILAGSNATVAITLIVKNGTAFSASKTFRPAYSDLTQRYGSNDVVNAIIGNDSSKYVENLIAFDPNILNDTDYDTGSFSECKSASLESVEYNQYDISELDDAPNITKSGTSYTGQATYFYTWFNQHHIFDNSLNYQGKIGLILTGRQDANTNFRFRVFYTDDSYEDLSYLTTTTSTLTMASASNKVVKYIGSHYSNNGSVTIDQICLFYYWDGSRIGYEPFKKHLYPLPNKDLNGILKVVNGKVVADGDELTPDGSGNKQNWYMYTFTGEEDWIAYSSGYRAVVLTGHEAQSISGPTIPTDIRTTTGLDIVSRDSIAGGASGISITGDTIIVSSTSNLVGKKVLYKLATPQDLTADNFLSTFYGDDFGVMRFLDENGNVIDGLQGNEIFYKANIGGFAESLYIEADGDPEYFASADDISDTALAERGYVKLTSITGYDATKTQVLKNVEGTLTWVDEE